jgi:hypothetical protein
MEPGRDLDVFGRALIQGQLSTIEQDFDLRVERYLASRDDISRDDAGVSEATKEVCKELYELRWGPTQVAIFNLLGLFRIIRPDQKTQYIDIAQFFIYKGVPVDGVDLSGTTGLSHSFSTKPATDFDYAQLLFDAGGDVNHRNRYGGTVAHEIGQVYPFQPGIKLAVESLEWFLNHGGSVDIADSDGMAPRQMCERLYRALPQLLRVIEREDRRRKAIQGSCCSLCGRETPKLLLCSRCKKAKYCPRESRECQKLDWPKHKKNCQSPGTTVLFLLSKLLFSSP